MPILIGGHNPSYEKNRKYLKYSNTVLDFACSPGITTVKLADSVKEVRSIDISKDMVGIAQKKIEAHNIDNVIFATCDFIIETFKDSSFEVVLAFNILHFLENIDEVLERVNQILIYGGSSYL